MDLGTDQRSRSVKEGRGRQLRSPSSVSPSRKSGGRATGIGDPAARNGEAIRLEMLVRASPRATRGWRRVICAQRVRTRELSTSVNLFGVGSRLTRCDCEASRVNRAFILGIEMFGTSFLVISAQEQNEVTSITIERIHLPAEMDFGKDTVSSIHVSSG